MKIRKAIVSLILAVSFAVLCMAAAGQTRRKSQSTPAAGEAEKRELKEKEEEKEPPEPAEAEEPAVERTIAADANVAVRVCVASGSITVHGWERNEVRARSSEVAAIEFQHEGEPARKIQLLIADKSQGPGRSTSCLSFSDVEMDVPRGATVQLQTRDGDITVADVATAYVNTQNGDVSIERASKAVDAGTIGGGISLKNSSGGVNLHSVGGNIEVNDVRPVEASDIFDASSVGGDIQLEQVAHARLNARSLNGSLSMNGALAHDGHYGFKTISGDVTLTLPVNSSFKLSARLSQNAEIITDFPITLMSYASAAPGASPKALALPRPNVTPNPTPSVTPAPDSPAPAPGALPPMAAPSVDMVSPVPPAEPQGDWPKGPGKIKAKGPRMVVENYPMRRLDGICGSGDAVIEVGSFSGTVHLKKQ